MHSLSHIISVAIYSFNPTARLFRDTNLGRVFVRVCVCVCLTVSVCAYVCVLKEKKNNFWQGVAQLAGSPRSHPSTA